MDMPKGSVVESGWNINRNYIISLFKFGQFLIVNNSFHTRSYLLKLIRNIYPKVL